MANKRKTTTSSEVNERYKKKTYKLYPVRLRKEDDADLIDFIEKNKDTTGMTELFREGLILLKNKGI